MFKIKEYFHNKCKKKKGIITILLCMLITFIIALMAYTIDGGKNYCTKTQMQAIADSMSLGGAKKGIMKSKNQFSDSKTDFYIDKTLALQKANFLLAANKPYLSVNNISAEYNLSSKGHQFEEKLYAAGILHVKLTATVTNIFTNSSSKIVVTATTKLTTNASSDSVNITKIKTETRATGDYIIITYANGSRQELRVDN